MVYGFVNREISCNGCKKTYTQKLSKQQSKLRVLSEDTCPYCGYIRSKSMAYTYDNTKLEAQ